MMDCSIRAIAAIGPEMQLKDTEMILRYPTLATDKNVRHQTLKSIGYSKQKCKPHTTQAEFITLH